ncbi:hypothetical protein BJY52DRAFT_1416027 [Lactarius psammicola]|nr:hypothetical protein BJY52DRAFT_1416027 [Lactarius psammicola]
MSAAEAPIKAGHLNELSDSVTAMVVCIVQEQLALILENIREHSRLLDWHSALLNHSTIMNRYNVGKLDDLRDLQTNVNNTTSVTSAPDSPTRQPMPAFEPPPASNSSSSSSPTPPQQVTADGRGASTIRRGLRRERAHDEIPDPMWNSSREIDLLEIVPAPVHSPPYVPSPAHTNGAACFETREDPSAQPPPSKMVIAGKKRRREGDASLCGAGVDPSDSGSECDEPERKRKRDTRIPTERIPYSGRFPQTGTLEHLRGAIF